MILRLQYWILIALCAVSLSNLGGLIIVAKSESDRRYTDYVSCRDRRDIRETVRELIEVRIRNQGLTPNEKDVFQERLNRLNEQLATEICGGLK